MKETRKIEVVPYNPEWPTQFKHEASLIKKTLGSNCEAIHHVGSTSVPGLFAKPKIDIIVVVKDPSTEMIEKLESVGFVYRGEYNIPFHYGFSKRDQVDVNLHVYQEGHPEIELNLTFRDYLRAHPPLRDEYGAWKLKLLEEKTSFEKNNSLFTGYNLGKDALIRKILKLAGFQRLRFLKCVHHEEWVIAKKLRQKYFDRVSAADPYGWTFNHSDHAHFVLCKGVEIIGYAHIQLWPHSRAALRIIVIEEAFRNQGFGRQFLEWIEMWLKGKGYRSLHVESYPEALSFYKLMGYSEMPFDDPEGDKGDARDTPLGKLL